MRKAFKFRASPALWGNPLIPDIFWVQVPWLVYPVPRPLRGKLSLLDKVPPIFALFCHIGSSSNLIEFLYSQPSFSLLPHLLCTSLGAQASRTGQGTLKDALASSPTPTLSLYLPPPFPVFPFRLPLSLQFPSSLPPPSSFLTSSNNDGTRLCPQRCSSPGAIAMEKWPAFALAVNIHEREMDNKPMS